MMSLSLVMGMVYTIRRSVLFDSVRLTLFLPCSAAAQASRTSLSDEDMDATSALGAVVISEMHLRNFMACAAARSLSCSFTMSDGLSAE